MRSLFFSALLLALPLPLVADTVYTYTGSPLNQVEFGSLANTSYTTTDSISGWFSLPTALAPNLAVTSTPIALTDFDFTDGVTSYTSADGLGFLFITTDSSGNLLNWYVNLFNDPSGDIDAIIDGFSTGNNGLGISDSVSSIPDQLGLYNADQPGSWTISSTDPTNSPVPEPSSLLLLATGTLGAAGTLRKKLQSR